MNEKSKIWRLLRFSNVQLRRVNSIFTLQEKHLLFLFRTLFHANVINRVQIYQKKKKDNNSTTPLGILNEKEKDNIKIAVPTYLDE